MIDSRVIMCLYVRLYIQPTTFYLNSQDKNVKQNIKTVVRH